MNAIYYSKIGTTVRINSFFSSQKNNSAVMRPKTLSSTACSSTEPVEFAPSGVRNLFNPAIDLLLSNDFVVPFSDETVNEFALNPPFRSSSASPGTELDQTNKSRRYANVAALLD